MIPLSWKNVPGLQSAKYILVQSSCSSFSKSLAFAKTTKYEQIFFLFGEKNAT
jgi:hypothetical protein